MPHRSLSLVFSFAVLLAAQPASACEPIAAWVVLAGPQWLPMTLLGLAGVIAAKCLAFTFLAHDIGTIRRPVYMLSGNAVSSVVGFALAFPFVAPSGGVALLLVALFVAGICSLPTKRLRSTMGWNHIGAGFFAFILILGIVLTGVFNGLATGALGANEISTYWILKLLYIALAFGISLFITVVFEEWTVWKLSGHTGASKNWFVPVLQANLFAFLLAGGIAATIMLPKRLRSPNFLVDLMETLRAVFV